MELLVDIEDINNACLPKYYPFCGSRNFDRIFFSTRYFTLLEDFLADNDIKVYLHPSSEAQFWNITLPEYADQDFVSIATSSIPHRDIRSYSNEIIIVTESPSNSAELPFNSAELKEITVVDLYNALCEAYNADKWYESIKAHTFKSILIPLSAQDMKSLAKMDFDEELIAKIDGGISRLSAVLRVVYSENERNTPIIIDVLVENGYFIKLYSVSPKNDDSTPADLTIRTGQEALKLLTSRTRTYNTICEFADSNSPHGIMLREFVPIDSDLEFRLFVFGNTLRAISQYKCYTEGLFPQSCRGVIYDAICKWFTIIEPDVPYADYVIDIVLCPENKDCFPHKDLFSHKILYLYKDLSPHTFARKDSIKVIEINSYGPGLLSGSGLYNWETDYDIMHYSTKPDIRFLD